MPGNPDEEDQPDDREGPSPPDSPDEESADGEEDREARSDEGEVVDADGRERAETGEQNEGDAEDERADTDDGAGGTGDETDTPDRDLERAIEAVSEQDDSGPESESVPDPVERAFDDPDQAPQADLSESWTDEPPAQFRESDTDDEVSTTGADAADEDSEGSTSDGESGDGDDSSVGEDTGGGDESSGEDDSSAGDETEAGDEDDSSESDDTGDEDEIGEGADTEDADGAAETDDAEREKVDFHDDATPLERKTGPESDTEQPLADHIEEMVRRLAVVVVVAGLVSLLAFPFGEEFITFLWYSVLPEGISQPHVYHPLELVITQLKAASLLGLVLALPVFVYETYAFMRPGLYPHERRYYLAAVPTSLVLAAIGLLFGYFIVLPAVMTYFLYYSRDVVDIAFALGQTFNLMLILLGYLALVFQIPLFIMLAIMMGLTTRTWMEDRRLIFWGAFLGISFLFSPDPTGMAPILVAATMIALFEGTLLLLRWTNRGG